MPNTNSCQLRRAAEKPACRTSCSTTSTRDYYSTYDSNSSWLVTVPVSITRVSSSGTVVICRAINAPTPKKRISPCRAKKSLNKDDKLKLFHYESSRGCPLPWPSHIGRLKTRFIQTIATTLCTHNLLGPFQQHTHPYWGACPQLGHSNNTYLTSL